MPGHELAHPHLQCSPPQHQPPPETAIHTANIYRTLPSSSRGFSKSCWEERAECWCSEDGIRTPNSTWEHGFVTEMEQEVRPPEFPQCFGVSVSALCVTVLDCYRDFSASEHPTDPLRWPREMIPCFPLDHPIGNTKLQHGVNFP